MLAVALASTLAAALSAQSGGSGANPPLASGSGGRSVTAPSTSQRPGLSGNGARRISYFTGLVMLDDGSPPPEAVTIEISCGGTAKPYGATDSAGAFTVNYGQPDSVALADPSYSGSGQTVGVAGSGLRKQAPGATLLNCELSARLPGFRSDPVHLGDRDQFDSPNVGSIILHRLENVSGYTFSMTTLNAPKNARKGYEKGLEAARESRWPEAEALFRKAVAVYPKYAVCWEALGRTLEVQTNLPEAQRSFERAAQADPRFVTPHLRLMALFGRAQRWEDVAGKAAAVIQLDPYSYPIAYYFGGIANLNLRRTGIAEREAREGLRVDTRHAVPRLNHLLGVLLMERKAYSEAVPYLKAYLQDQPASTDAETVKSAIEYAEKMTRTPDDHEAPR